MVALEPANDLRLAAALAALLASGFAALALRTARHVSDDVRAREALWLATAVLVAATAPLALERHALTVSLAAIGVLFVRSAGRLGAQSITWVGFAALARDNLAKGRTAVQLAAKHPEVLAHLKLATRSAAPLPWRGIRAALVALGDAWPGVPEALIRLTERLERRRPAWLQSYYPAALAYFYWLGARAAAREPRGVMTGGENVA